MSHSYICCLVHVVFSTSGRRATIHRDMEQRLHDYIGGIARTNGMETLIVGGTADHLHILLALPRTMSVGKAVQLVKSGSSKWVHEHFPGSPHFSWQEGYGAFSIGSSQRAATMRYIQNQHEHHQRITFADEMKKFLSAYGINE